MEANLKTNSSHKHLNPWLYEPLHHKQDMSVHSQSLCWHSKKNYQAIFQSLEILSPITCTKLTSWGALNLPTGSQLAEPCAHTAGGKEGQESPLPKYTNLPTWLWTVGPEDLKRGFCNHRTRVLCRYLIHNQHPAPPIPLHRVKCYPPFTEELSSLPGDSEEVSGKHKDQTTRLVSRFNKLISSCGFLQE